MLRQVLVDSQWLKKNINNVKVLDSSWWISKEARQKHRTVVPGAKFFDIDEVADRRTWLPHMAPSALEFSGHMDRLGIGKDDEVLLYDHSGGQLVASARAWWTFRLFGHERVRVLDGGFPAWPRGLCAREFGASSGYRAALRSEWLALKQDLMHNIDLIDGQSEGGGEPFTVVDARSEDRFYARVDEPRDDVPRGSIPHSMNLHFTDLLAPRAEGEDFQRMLPTERLQELFDERHVPTGDRLVLSCGTGVTACVLALALYEAGHEDLAVYDGSWTEWGVAEDTPKVIHRRKQSPPSPPLEDEMK